jgi:hypothetical protein
MKIGILKINRALGAEASIQINPLVYYLLMGLGYYFFNLGYC